MTKRNRQIQLTALCLVACVLAAAPVNGGDLNDPVVEAGRRIEKLRDEAIAEHERLKSFGMPALVKGVKVTNDSLARLIEAFSAPNRDEAAVVEGLEQIATGLDELMAEAPAIFQQRHNELEALAKRGDAFGKTGRELEAMAAQMTPAIDQLKAQLKDDLGNLDKEDRLDNLVGAFDGLRRAAHRASILDDTFSKTTVDAASRETALATIYYSLKKLQRDARRAAVLGRLDLAVGGVMDEFNALQQAAELSRLIGEAAERLREIDSQINESLNDRMGVPAY